MVGKEPATALIDLDGKADTKAVFEETLSVSPFSSTRQYKSLRLSPNGLQVLLVCDKRAAQASAALTIGGAGQFADPPDLSGLAHLMEHMTLSSRSGRRRRNKDAQDFEEWLTDVDGSSNGFTAYEKVCFHFQCPMEALQEALQRLARDLQQDVIEQVCRNEEVLQREIRRINSELDSSNGFLRELYLTKTLINPDHPYARPSAGNIQTLESIPRQQGIDVGDRLVDFFKKNYQPRRAVLTVISSHELSSSLESWVAPFAFVLSREHCPPHQSGNNDENDCEDGVFHSRSFPEFFPRQSKITTICMFRKQKGGSDDDLEKLSFQWGLNLDYRNIESEQVVTATQIGFILAQILGRRGPGSLYTLLKRRQWVPDGTRGLPKISFPADVPGFQILRLEITLTPSGFSSRSAVIAAVYDSINSLQGNNPVLNPFVLGRELLAEYCTIAQLYGFVLAPRPPDAIELAFDAQLYGVAGPRGVGNPMWRLFPPPQDRDGIATIQKGLQQTLTLMSDPGTAIIISTASKRSIQRSGANFLDTTFPEFSPASWSISPVTGARYYYDNMFRLTGKVDEWLVARLMEDELQPPVINPLVPPTIRPPRIPGTGEQRGDTSLEESSLLTVVDSILHRKERAGNNVLKDYSDGQTQSSILRDFWAVLQVSSFPPSYPALQLPRVPPEPSCRCSFVLQLLSSRPARANSQMAARAELWKMSLEYALGDLVRSLHFLDPANIRRKISNAVDVFLNRPNWVLPQVWRMKSVSTSSE